MWARLSWLCPKAKAVMTALPKPISSKDPVIGNPRGLKNMFAAATSMVPTRKTPPTQSIHRFTALLNFSNKTIHNPVIGICLLFEICYLGFPLVSPHSQFALLILGLQGKQVIKKCLCRESLVRACFQPVIDNRAHLLVPEFVFILA